MKTLLLYLMIAVTYSFSCNAKNKLEIKLDNLKKQTVIFHNNIIENNKELKKIKVDIDRNKQKQIIFYKYIKDREILGKRLFILLQEKLYVSEFSRILKSMQTQSNKIVTKQIIRGYFFNQVKVGINNYFENVQNLDVINKELKKELTNYNKKKEKLRKELSKLEKKIKQVSILQKQFVVNPNIKKREKNAKKKAKNINELVKGVEVKKLRSVKKIKTLFQMPIEANIISEFGQNKKSKIFENGVIFEVAEESFVTSPLDGVVVFANKFKSYGNLVIIENNNGYFCILSGMQKIIISSGNKVFKGEPIARVSEKAKNKLYFELRKNGKIINPKSKVEIL